MRSLITIRLPFEVTQPILAMGSQTKNTLCYAHGTIAVVSEVRADLADPDTFACFEKEVRYFLRCKPKTIAFDLHPGYQASQYALRFAVGRRMVAVQHHHAHIAACMAEHGLNNQRVIGVAFDGTGLGSDGTLWGAEFLIATYTQYQRIAHLREVPLLGGAMAIREPWRLAAWWLQLLQHDTLSQSAVPWARRFSPRAWKVLQRLEKQKFNAPLASSMGRLFDAAASLILNKHVASSEAALAVALEKKALRVPGQPKAPLNVRSYRFSITQKNGMYCIDPAPMFFELMQDSRKRVAQEISAYRFHVTVARMIRQACCLIKKKTALTTVVLSGGVFQNRLLLRLARDVLQAEGFVVIQHCAMPSHDANVALGQAAIAQHHQASLKKGGVL